jgi:hypothetical protein
MTDSDSVGHCSKGSCSCNGDSAVCHLNPKAGKQTEFITFGTSARGALMYNRSCCSFRSCEVAKRSLENR